MPLLPIRLLCTLLCLLAAATPTAASAAGVRVAAPPDVIADLDTLLAGRTPLQVSRYDGPGARRDVAELLLVQQALALGGDTRPVVLVPAPTYRRMLALVADGHADVTGTSVWGADIAASAGQLRATRALIDDGEFVAAFFHAAQGKPVREKILGGHWPALSAVSSHSWNPDWLVLNRLGLSQLYDVPEWPAMVRMVGAGRADFLLAPFPANGGTRLHLEEVTLEAVPGLCLALAGSRHLAVRGDAGALQATLEQGLSSLRSKGTIQRAYTEAGFWSPASRSCRKVIPAGPTKPASAAHSP